MTYGTVHDLPALRSRDSLESNHRATKQELELLAREPALIVYRDQLNDLAYAIEHGGEASAVWHGTSLIDYFSPWNLAVPTRSPRLGRLLDVVTAVIMFLPVTWTWVSLRSALEAYRQFLSTNQDEQRSFLQLWTQGFDGGIARHFALPEVALGSAALLAVAVALVMVERIMRQVHESREAWRASRRSQRLARVLLLAERTISLRAEMSAGEAAEALRSAGTALNEVLRETAGTCEELRTSTETLQGVLAEGSEALRASLSDGSTHLASKVVDVTTSFTDAVKASADALAEGSQKSVGPLVELVGALKEAGQSQESAAAAAAETSRSVVAAVNAMESQIDTLRHALNDAINTVGVSAQGLEASLGGAISALQQEARKMADAPALLGSSLNGHTQALQHQITELTQIRAELQRLDGTSSGQAKSAKEVAS